MMSNKGSLVVGYSSAGHRASNIERIDAHYVVCRKSYEAMLRAVGIQPGWNVLDAGCGSGSFLPLMAELVGPSGKIDAFDLAPENVERVRNFVEAWDVPVETRVGNLTELPYADNEFDVIWNANVSQYLTDDEMAQMLKELVRVAKPGGLIALKEVDITVFQMYPLDIFVFWRWIEKNPHVNFLPIRLHKYSTWFKDAGLVEISQETFLEEIHAPLSDYEHNFMAGGLQLFAEEAEEFALPESDMVQWRRCQNPDSPDNPVNHPNFFFREGHTLVIGKKPPAN